MTIHQKIGNLIVKANRLKTKNHKLHSDNERLEADLKKLKQELESELKKGAELENQIKIIKLARNISAPEQGGTDVTELKRKINEYIKEIDSCITMLND